MRGKKGIKAKCHPTRIHQAKGLCSTCYKNYRARVVGENKYFLKYRYNIDLAKFKETIVQQDGRCACCSTRAKLVIDHNHMTNKFRALLCTRCNLALFVIETPGFLDQLYKYLSVYGG